MHDTDLDNPVLDQAGACVDVLGRPAFDEQLFTLLQKELGIEQCMVFAYRDGERMDCLLYANPRLPETARHLADRYVRGQFRNDPNYPRVQALLAGDAATARPEPMPAEAMPAAYREAFFARPALVDKLSVRFAGDGVGYYVNLYRGREAGVFTDSEVARVSTLAPLLASLIRRHHSLRDERGRAARDETHLAVLSPREHELCRLLLQGHTLKSAAAEATMSPATADTLRRRAYRKLAVRSRAELARRYHGVGR
ncbi:helix-turn-helix transcriptional regulator [Arhodomonas sp. SL1]|uniref:helix-turn-helix transcriptional regulator n=1 Tax=Arhodomonas sp. SL1 TaxID=3425691 RepID=UPI003F8833A7